VTVSLSTTNLEGSGRYPGQGGIYQYVGHTHRESEYNEGRRTANEKAKHITGEYRIQREK
jgi:hypothetical protein